MQGGRLVRPLGWMPSERSVGMRRTLWVAAFVMMLMGFALHTGAARAATPPQALVLGDTVTAGLPADDGFAGATPDESIEQYEAEQDGFQVTVVDGTTWDSMTAAQFAQYQVLIIGDPTCGPADGVGDFQAAVANETTWEPVVMGSGGNKVIIGTDPTYHWFYGSGPNADVLEANGIAYAGALAGSTGAYVDLSCTYTDSENGTPVPLLDGLSSYGAGQFTVGGAPCAGSISVIAATGPTAGLSDGDLSGWECSVHEFFTTFPADYTPLALATDPSVPVTYTGTDVSTGNPASGSPYILVSGGGITISSNLVLSPASQTLNAGTAGTVVATLVDSTDSAPIVGATVTFAVTSGPDTGQTSSGVTNASGQVSFTYTNSGTLGTDQILATSINDGVTSQGTATITWQNLLPPTSLTTALSGNDQTPGPTISVPTGTYVTDSATLSGTNAATATGTITYNVYTDSACSDLFNGGTAETITDGAVPSSAPVQLSPGGTYYWQAVYSGDSANAGSTSTCGSEVATVTEPVITVTNTTTTPGTTTTVTNTSTVTVPQTTTIQNTSATTPTCPAPVGAVGGTAVGVFSIGMTQSQARATLARYNVTENKFDNFCLYHGWGIRLGYPTGALLKTVAKSERSMYSSHVVLALTANAYYALMGARPGTKVASVAKHLQLGKPFKVGSNDWYFGAGSYARAIVKVRNGVIQEVGLASLGLTTTRSQERVFITSFDKF
jgi:hypothetical protein